MSTSANECGYFTLQNEMLSELLHNNTERGQNSTKNQKSVSAYCCVVYSSNKSWYKVINASL